MNRQYIDWSFDVELISDLDNAVANFKVGGGDRPDEEFLNSGLVEYTESVIRTFAESDDPKSLSLQYWEYLYLSFGLRWGSSDVRARALREERQRSLLNDDLEGIIFEEYIERLNRYKLIQHQKKKHYLAFSRYYRDSVFQPIGRTLLREHEPKLAMVGHYIQELREAPPLQESTTADISRLIGLSTRQIQRYLT